MPQTLNVSTPSGETVWMVERLWAAAKSLPVKRVPIDEIAEFDRDCWFDGKAPTCREVAEHMKRIQSADLEQPVILSADGMLMDGVHRVAKAWLLGMQTINAVQFQQTPEPDMTMGSAK